jgi:putative membrane protein
MTRVSIVYGRCGKFARVAVGKRSAAGHFPRMNQGPKPFLIRWLCTTLAVWVAVKLTGMSADGWVPLLGTALFLGIINAVVRPVLLLLSVPFIIVTLGLFILILNALLLWFAGGLVPGFHVHGFWNAFFGAIIVSLVNWVLSIFFKGSDGEIHVLTHHGQLRAGGEKRVDGRVIGNDE